MADLTPDELGVPMVPAASDAPKRIQKGKRDNWAGMPGMPKPDSDAATQTPVQAQQATQASRQPGTQDTPQTPGDVRPGLSGGNKGNGWQPGRASEESPAAKGNDRERIKGLNTLPKDWPQLPTNASLTSEVAWVQANRLYVVEEKSSGGIVVHLDRAHEPAPSRAAIGWLETSIRSYAKWVEVAAKASGAEQDEQAYVKRERARIEDIRAVLAEMLEERGDR